MTFMPFGRQVGLAGHPSPALSQTNGSSAAMSPSSGEPSLERALSSLSPDEVQDYKSWGAKEKLLFLSGYQWVSVATAKGLHRVDGTPFDGFLPQGIVKALSFLTTISPFLTQSADLAAGANQASTVTQEAQQKTMPQGQAIAAKYRLLRDRIAWELAMQGATVEFEIVGDDPSNPGVIYTRKVGEDKSPDYSAVFSTMTPKEMWESGLALEDKYAAGGVTFKKLDLSGANPRMGVGGVPVLALVITAVVAVLAFFWLYSHVNQTKKMTDTAISIINNDPNLSTQQKLDAITRLKDSNSFFDDMFGQKFPWTTLVIGAAVVGAAYFLLPSIVAFFSPKQYPVRRPAHA